MSWLFHYIIMHIFVKLQSNQAHIALMTLLYTAQSTVDSWKVIAAYIRN